MAEKFQMMHPKKNCLDWESEDTEVFINPRMPNGQLKYLNACDFHKNWKGHIWLLTSGTTSKPNEYKWVALSKRAFVVSASAVNKHLESTKEDIWLNVLPYFHVGGLAITARAWLSGAQVINFDLKWTAQNFYKGLVENKCTLTAVVPAQVYDLVSAKLSCPPSLRAMVVGGGAMNQTLYEQAKLLGWPVLPSYGFTECASQVATARLDSPHLIPLEHVEIKRSSEGYLAIKSEALLTTYAIQVKDQIHFVDPKKEGWFQTEDRGNILKDHLEILGRFSDFIKIGGESVSLSHLESIFEEVKLKYNAHQDMALMAIPDERLGHSIQLVVERCLPENFDVIIECYNQKVMPFEKIRKSQVVSKIPRTPLKKIIKSELLSILKS